MNLAAKKEIEEVLEEFGIMTNADLYSKDGDTVAYLYERLKPVTEIYDLSDDDMEELLEAILG